MPLFSLSPSLLDFHAVLLALSSHRFPDHAENLFREFRSQFPATAKTYTILISGWAKVPDGVQKARELFDEMLRDGIAPDVSAYNALIAALCGRGEVAEAHERVREMQRLHGIPPDAATYGVFVRAACEAKDLHGAVRVLDRMKRKGLVPNVFTCNAVVRLMCERGEVDAAHAMLDEMVELGATPDVWSYNAVLEAHCRSKEVNRALRFLKRMDDECCAPDRHTYNMLLKMLIGVGRVDRATEVWEGMEGRGYHPVAANYAVMIHGLCRMKGKAETACEYFDMMVETGIPPYNSTCWLLRERLLKLGMGRTLQMLIEKMRRSSSHSIRELSGIMDGASASGKPEVGTVGCSRIHSAGKSEKKSEKKEREKKGRFVESREERADAWTEKIISSALRWEKMQEQG